MIRRIIRLTTLTILSWSASHCQTFSKTNDAVVYQCLEGHWHNSLAGGPEDFDRQWICDKVHPLVRYEKVIYEIGEVWHGSLDTVTIKAPRRFTEEK